MTIPVKISQMAQHFLYLPLYYARHRDYFGYIPDDYAVVIDTIPQGTDQAAFHSLMDIQSGANEQVQFAVCDPAQCFVHARDVQPVLLASLVTNAAFWAIDRKGDFVRHYRELATYEKIVTYPPGTTSYSIGRRITTEGEGPAELLPVLPRQELVALRDEPNAIALSPEILEIEKLVHNGDFRIEFAFGGCPEYYGTLVTGLLTRRDVLETHPGLVQGLMHALQEAMLAVKFEHADVVSFASDYFSSDSSRVASALTRANDASVFPATLEVSETQVVHAVAADAEARDGSGAQSEMPDARSEYERIAQPFLGYARRSSQEMLSRILETDDPIKIDSEDLKGRKFFAPLLSALLIIFGATVASYLGWISAAIAGGTILVFGLLQKYLSIKTISIKSGVHWLLGVAFATVLIVLDVEKLSENTEYFLYSVLVAIALTVAANILSRSIAAKSRE